MNVGEMDKTDEHSTNETEQGTKDEECKDVLESLPSDVKTIIEEKMKTLPTAKKPIVMPKVEEIYEITESEASGSKVEKTTVTKSEASGSKVTIIKGAVKPIEVRLLSGRLPKNTDQVQSTEQRSSLTIPARQPVSQQVQRTEKRNSVAAPSYLPYALDNYPKGIPRSFLKQQHNMGAFQPQNSASFMPAESQYSLPYAENIPGFAPTTPMFVQTANIPENTPQAYSPSEVYTEMSSNANDNQESHEGSESPDICQPGQKRLSAFQRLGPVTQPKKPKLTINLSFNKEQSVREVVDETENDEEKDKYTPVHLRPYIQTSTDDIVMKYLVFWPWKKNLSVKKTVSARSSKSVMLLEQEQMEEVYKKDNIFIKVSVKGYPPSWNKEDVLDAVLESVKGKTFIPCFIEFEQNECKFLVIRCCPALIAIHKQSFTIIKDDIKLSISLSQMHLSLNQIDFIPRLILRKKLAQANSEEKKLMLNEFTLQKDISHFIYYPLNRLTNQTEIIQMQSAVPWRLLTDLDLSNNRITSIDGFELAKTTPKLKHLNLSNNCIEKVTSLLKIRDLSLRSLKLEGNPLCHDYIDPAHYVKVVKMIFSGLTEIDGVPITLKGDLPPPKINYCPENAKDIVDKFLEVFFPLLDTTEERTLIRDMYDENATLSLTYNHKLRSNPMFRYLRTLFLRCRSFDEGEMDLLEGAATIAKHIAKWPAFEHDPYTFHIDVLFHSESTTIVRVGGILKLTSESLAEDEHLLSFCRTLVLHSKNRVEYKIKNELVYWDAPDEKYANTAFQTTVVKPRRLTLKMESTPDEDLKKKLVKVFMKITELDKKKSERCLEMKNWDFKNALEYVIKLLKLDSLDSLKSEESTKTT